MNNLPVQTVIPDGEILYRYCYPNIFPKGQTEIPVSIFNDPELSCDWERYQKNPFSTFHMQEGRICVIQITVCDAIRNPTNPKRVGQVVPDWHQDIVHAPVAAEDDTVHGANESHSLIRGPKKSAVIEAIRDNAVIYGTAPE